MPCLVRRQVLIGSAALGATIVTGPVLAAGEIGRAVVTQGSVVLERAATLIPLGPDDALQERDLVQTGVQSYAELFLNEATQINLGPETAFEIDSFVAAIGGQITIGGAMAFDRPDDLPPIDLTLRTAFARIGVRGTRFFLGPSQGVFSVFVARGAVQVSTTDVLLSLSAGEGVEIAGPGAAPGDIVNWGAARIAAAFASVGLPS
jgi:ferric-dicitrate binding protein FerR (iron transport regulator)